MLIVFAALTIFFLAGKTIFQHTGADTVVLACGNALIFLVVLGSYFMVKKSLHASNHHAFVRAIYSSFIAKFFALAIAAFIFFYVSKEVNKVTLFIFAGLYFLYTFLEVQALTKLLKQKKNA